MYVRIPPAAGSEAVPRLQVYSVPLTTTGGYEHPLDGINIHTPRKLELFITELHILAPAQFSRCGVNPRFPSVVHILSTHYRKPQTSPGNLKYLFGSHNRCGCDLNLIFLNLNLFVTLCVDFTSFHIVC